MESNARVPGAVLIVYVSIHLAEEPGRAVRATPEQSWRHLRVADRVLDVSYVRAQISSIARRSQQAGARVFFKNFGIADVAAQRF
jgi:hypothetical protein